MTVHPYLFNVLEFGAAADGKTDCTQALQKTVDACVQAGGGQVLLPPGIYLCGALRLGSYVDLHLAPGAILQGSPHLSAFPIEEQPLSIESRRAGLITAVDAQQVSITGQGTIDGQGYHFIDLDVWKVGSDYDPHFTRQGEAYMHPRFGTQHGPQSVGDRPGNLIRFFRCQNVLIEGVTICNAPTWTVHINTCELVNILGVHIHSLDSDCRVPNDDGIDLRFSRRVHIANCDIQTGDDCIALFGSQQVTVTNCTLASKSSGLRVGWDLGQLQDCSFNNLIIHAHRGINVCVRGSGSVENILFSDLVIRTQLLTGHWWGNGEPIHISSGRGFSDTQPLGTIKHLRFHNIMAESEQGILVYGCPESPIEDVLLEDVQLHIKASPLQKSYGGNIDLRGLADLSHAVFEHEIPGLYARYVNDLDLRRLRLSWDGGLPEFYTDGIACEHFNALTIENFRGAPARSDACSIALRDGKIVHLHHCHLPAGAINAEQVEDLEVE